MEVGARNSSSLLEAASNMFNRLKHCLRDDAVILCHSMGAMFILKILSEPQYFRSENPELYARIVNSRIIFLQVPLHVNELLLTSMGLFQFLFYPVFFVYNLLIFPVVDFVLMLIKYLVAIAEKLVLRVPGLKYLLAWIFKPVNLLLNLCLVTNTFWGTKPSEFMNVVKFYKQWRDFSLDGFFAADLAGSSFDRAVIGATENTMAKFDRSNVGNYVFTTCVTDWFCEPRLTQDFARRLGAEVKELNFGFHSPQHCFWHQPAIEVLVERSDM
jgi:predicted alpha/beta hydrolase family esterase